VAFQKLTRAGIPGDLLWRYLWGLAWLKKSSAKQKSPWYALPGLPPHSLRRFPDRVRRMAAEIEDVDKKIRSDKVYGPTVAYLLLFLAEAIPGAEYELRGNGGVLRGGGTGMRSVPVALARGVLQRQAELPQLVELPKLLRFYADYVEVVDRLVAHHAPKGASLLKAMTPIELVETVKKLTGKPHTNDIATLLEAAYYAVGINEGVDPRNLKMLYRRRVPRKK
jgi:hypothetical protein